MSSSRLFLAALGLMCAAAPAYAQSIHRMDDDYTVSVQNNGDEEVTVYFDSGDLPFERTLGTVEAMRMATFALPEYLVRDHETVKLLVQPRGGLPKEARVLVRRPDEGMHLAITLPNKESDDALTVVSTDVVATGPSVTVHNHEGETAQVFLMSGTRMQRLGTVNGESVMTFPVPAGWTGLSGEIVLARDGAPAVSTPVSFGAHEHVGVLLD